MKYNHFLLLVSALFLLPSESLRSQNIGLLTDSPDAPVHIASSGQVNIAGGLLLLGSRDEGHLEMDFDLLQSRYGANDFLPLRLQPIGGRVGINTSFPAAALHVFGAGQVNTPGGLLQLGNPIEAHLLVDYDIIQSLYGAGSYLPLHLQPSGGNLEVGDALIYADRTNHFVGINTGNPDTELQLHGEMRMTTAGVSTTQKDKIAIHGQLESQSMLGLGWVKTSLGIGTGGLTGGGESRTSVADAYEMYYRSEGAHRWFINQVPSASPQMILSVDGKLGVGPATPDSKLHITGGTDINGIGASGYAQLGTTGGLNMVMDRNIIQGRNDGNPSSIALQRFGGDLFMANANTSHISIGTLTTSDAKVLIFGGGDVTLTSGGALALGTPNGTNLVMDTDEILARNAGGPANLSMQRDTGNLFLCGLRKGQVAIGIDNPNDLPDTDFKLAVNGKIISEEVRVELLQDWPDYVFNEDYQLTELETLHSNIISLGHLPGMPSADNVRSNGIELGEMQRRLLEKVEELTLYVIQLDAENKELRKEIDGLKTAQKK